VITATALTRRFGSRTAVSDLSIEIGRSEIVALLGPNGAGKTTTLRMLAGLIGPTSGTIAIDGVALSRSTAGVLRSRIGFLPETPGLWDRLTVRENLLTYAGLYGVADRTHAVDRILDRLQMLDRAPTRTAELSKGMRQKAALARTLLHNPTVLLLDEPMSGLDPEISREVRQILIERRSAGCAILVSTHNLDAAERLADRVVVLHERVLAAGPPDELRRRLTTGRVLVRLDGDAAAQLEVARRFDPHAEADGATLTLHMPPDRVQTPEIVAALVGAGARLLDVRQEIPALEDVYLHLVADR